MLMFIKIQQFQTCYDRFAEIRKRHLWRPVEVLAPAVIKVLQGGGHALNYEAY